jgi:hypothetical protein
MFSKLVLAATLVAAAQAACPNSCSGHGTCGSNEVCTCYDGWGMGGAQGGDCSDRFCPSELAWVDTPDVDGVQHKYAECAAKGICDRETGECACFGGFEGKACGRQTCPDGCSGHGTCEFMGDLTFATVYNDYYDATSDAKRGVGVGSTKKGSANVWDSDRARACVCDAGWTGINCAARMCPFGNDVMDLRANTGVAANAQVQTITLLSGGADGGQLDYPQDTLADFNGKSFALTFTSKMNETFTTVPIELASADAAGLSDIANDVDAALQNLPNRVISGGTDGGVKVTALSISWSASLIIQVTFTGTSVHGRQNLLEVNVNSCGSGCTPMLDGLEYVLVSAVNATTNAATKLAQGTKSSVKETTAADYNSFECGRRGKCDFDTGVCACFEGYTGEACTTLTALI